MSKTVKVAQTGDLSPGTGKVVQANGRSMFPMAELDVGLSQNLLAIRHRSISIMGLLFDS